MTTPDHHIIWRPQVLCGKASLTMSIIDHQVLLIPITKLGIETLHFLRRIWSKPLIPRTNNLVVLIIITNRDG